jgi:trans-aconitate methyltransferase
VVEEEVQRQQLRVSRLCQEVLAAVQQEMVEKVVDLECRDKEMLEVMPSVQELILVVLVVAALVLPEKMQLALPLLEMEVPEQVSIRVGVPTRILEKMLGEHIIMQAVAAEENFKLILLALAALAAAAVDPQDHYHQGALVILV